MTLSWRANQVRAKTDLPEQPTPNSMATSPRRKHLAIDTAMPRAGLIEDLQCQGYQVEVHAMELELGICQPMAEPLRADVVDDESSNRCVPCTPFTRCSSSHFQIIHS